jgi:predicted dehydrogenase
VKPNQDQTLGVAVWGAGTIADVHLQALAALPGTRVRGIWSRQPHNAEAKGQTFAVPAFSERAALLAADGVDVVVILTSSGSHASLALEALAAGKHVLCEKPMAMSSDEARTVIQMARDKGLVLGVVSQRRFEPHHAAARSAVASGALGRLLLVEVACPYHRTQAYYDQAPWRGTHREDGGALMNQAIHSVDLLGWIAGRVTSVVAETATQTHQMEAEDLALAVARLEGGGFATVMASTNLIPGFAPTMNIYGERGSIRLAGGAIADWVVPGVTAPALVADTAVRGGTAILGSATFHQAQWTDFLAAVRQGRAPLVSGEDGFAAVAFVEAVYESARRGGLRVVPASL